MTNNQRATDDLPRDYKPGDPAFCPVCKCVHPAGECKTPGSAAAMYVTLPEFLTEEELEQAQKLFDTAKPGSFISRCVAEILQPQMARINKALGQTNDATYLAYAVEYVLGERARVVQEKNEETA